MSRPPRFADPRRAFHAWGLLGLVAAILLGAALTVAGGRSLAMTGVLALAAVTASGLLVAGSTRRGGSRLVYYHHELTILAVSGALLALAGGPVLAYLDITVLAVGAFLVFGRLGCLAVGCCHGRPAGHGVRYTPAHAAAGLPAHLVGVPLLPVQAVESAGVLATVAAGCVLILHAAPGAALACYVAGYGGLRFGLEFLRGDAGRPSWAGFTQAQWISLALCALAVAGHRAGLLPPIGWDEPVLVALLGAMLTAAGLRRRAASAHRLRDPQHVAELAATLAALARPGPPVRATSRGLHLSAGRTATGIGLVTHYALSARPDPLTVHQARTVGAVLGRLQDCRPTLLPGATPGLFHLLIPPPGRPDDVPAGRGTASRGGAVKARPR
ncbi:MAG TPA: prolipoprotein diacylglyceryl transferase family protein [Mycobacteriales bacterium]|nr:prolipoprotein diacylglyceryl transferase family protein [Mycobacteriales bacterium]